jgi:hypothetical protein
MSLTSGIVQFEDFHSLAAIRAALTVIQEAQRKAAIHKFIDLRSLS